MKTQRAPFLPAFLMTLSIALAGCGGGGADGAGGEEQTDPLNITVDAVDGDDQNPGSENAPFKSITRALAVVASGGTITVRMGTYDDANGESFPLQVPTNVRLTGDPSSPQRPMIVGSGLAPASVTDRNDQTTLIPGLASEIARLDLMNDGNGPAASRSVIMAAFSRAILRNSLIHDAQIGIYVPSGTAGLLVQGCSIRRTLVGMLMAGGDNSIVERTSIRESDTGVLIAEPVTDLDLGGGAHGSQGDNAFVGNFSADLFVPQGNSVSAQNNFWDEAPASEYIGSNPPAGVDVWRRGPQALVDTTGAKEASQFPGQIELPDSGPVTQGP